AAHVAGDAISVEADASQTDSRKQAHPPARKLMPACGPGGRDTTEEDGPERRQGDGDGHERIVVGAAEMQQPRFTRGAEQSGTSHRRDGSCRRQAKDLGSLAGAGVADPLGAEAKQAGEKYRNRSPKRCAVKQVLPAEAAGPL